MLADVTHKCQIFSSRYHEQSKMNFFHSSLVPMSWGKDTYDELTRLGVPGEFKTLKNTLHELKAAELLEIQEWISKLVPPLESDIQNKL